MKRSVVETLLGAAILIVAGLFFAYSYEAADVGTKDGYTIQANFSGIGGLKPGDEVQISGVKIGAVEEIALDNNTYLANVFMSINSDVDLPADTAAKIGSTSLLGGLYLALEPGGDEEIMEEGDIIQYTQAPQNLEELLGKFIFSMSEEKK